MRPQNVGGPVEQLGQLHSVALTRSGAPIETGTYDYYDGSDSNGADGDLKSATITNASGTVIGKNYYVYANGALEYVFDSTSIARMAGAGISLPLPDHLAWELDYAQYAQYAFATSGGVVGLQTIQGASASSKGSPDARGSFSYSFTPQAVGPQVAINAANMQVRVTPPDGVAQTVTTNFAGEMLSSSMNDSGDANGALNGKTWTTTYAYNADARLTTTTSPSGLQSVTDYYAPGGSQPAGYVQDTKLVSPAGSGAGSALQSYFEYTPKTDNGNTIYLLATSTVFSSAATSFLDSSAETTSYSYGMDHLGVTSKVTTPPGVLDQGGILPVHDITTDSYNTLGWLTNSYDPAGKDTSYSYDLATGAQTGTTQQMGVGEPLISTSEVVDIYGRPTSMTDADGNPTSMSYTDGLMDSTVTTTPPSGAAVTVVDNNAEAGTVTTTDHAGSASGTVLSKSIETDDLAGRAVEQQNYTGSSTALETDYAYNNQGQQNQTIRPDGTVNQTLFDNLGRAFQQLVGGGSHWTLENEQIYDGNAVGDGNPTQSINDPAGTSRDVTNIFNDWRDRQVASESGLGQGSDVGNALIQYASLNNFGDALTHFTYAGALTSIGSISAGVPVQPSNASALRAKSSSTFDALGRGSLGTATAVNPQTGALGDTITTQPIYDLNGDVVSSSGSASGDTGGGSSFSTDAAKAVTHTTTDEAGRVTRQWTTIGDSGTTTSEIRTQYDPNGNAIFITKSALEPGGSNRVSYIGNWYDANGRLTTSVDFGTNNGTAMTSRPSTIPTRSATPGSARVTGFTYTLEGYTDTVTDPRGLVGKTYYDELGRTTKTIANWDGTDTAAPTPTANQTTAYTYNSAGQVATQTAILPEGLHQTTQYNYGTSGNNFDKSLLLSVQYPDLATGDPSSSQQVTYTYNSAGRRVTMTDRDGTKHEYTYDDQGNQLTDVVTNLGSHVDGRVTERDTAYNALGQPTLFTTRDGAGNVLSQVKRTYDGFGNVIAEAQKHDGQVDDYGYTPTVSYGYQVTAGGQERPSSITYPDYRRVDYGYGSSGSMTDALGWVASISDGNSFGDHTLATYSYLGDGALIEQSRPQAVITQNVTLDNFGNTAELNWVNSSDTSIENFGYGYDANGNVLYKENKLLPTASELYHVNGASYGYDGLNRLTTFARGTLTASVTGGPLDTIASPIHSQSWGLDAIGNQTSVTTDGAAQTKAHNLQNQTTAVTTGATTSSLSYDANGSTTTDEQGRHLTFDAWGHLVSIRNASGTLIESYTYDALGRRITQTTPTGTTDLYYSTSGQVLQEVLSGNLVAQNVYGTTYVNDVIERDQSTSAPGTLGQRVYFQQDANHNVTSLADTSGNVLERYIYDPYGKVTVLNASGAVKGDGTFASSSYNVPNLFQGMRYDVAIGNYTTPNRDYDPNLGTWEEADPAGYVDGMSLYQLARGNPSDRVDPVGLETTKPVEAKDLFAPRTKWIDISPVGKTRTPWYSASAGGDNSVTGAKEHVFSPMLRFYAVTGRDGKDIEIHWELVYWYSLYYMDQVPLGPPDSLPALSFKQYIHRDTTFMGNAIKDVDGLDHADHAKGIPAGDEQQPEWRSIQVLGPNFPALAPRTGRTVEDKNSHRAPTVWLLADNPRCTHVAKLTPKGKDIDFTSMDSSIIFTVDTYYSYPGVEPKKVDSLKFGFNITYDSTRTILGSDGLPEIAPWAISWMDSGSFVNLKASKKTNETVGKI